MITPQEFIERYNRVVGWNREILEFFNLFDRNYLSNDKLVKDIVDDVLCTEPIQEDLYDLKTSHVFETVDKNSEDMWIQVHNGGWTLFTLRLDDTDEKTYKDRKVGELVVKIEESDANIEKEMEKLRNDRYGLNVLRAIIDKYDRKRENEKNIDSVSCKSEFIAMVREMSDRRPDGIRYGQSVYNNVDMCFGVALEVISEHKTADCFYNDSKVDEFLDECWKEIEKIKTNRK